MRRNSSEKEKGLANETKEGPEDGVLEFPSRRLSISSKSETSSVNENFANAKDMWKKRESAVNNAPVLPPGYMRDQRSRNNSLKGLGDNASIDSSTSPRNSRNFWKQRDSIGGSGKVPSPTNHGRLSRQASNKSRGEESDSGQVRKRLSVDGISIPVVDHPKANENKDSFDMPDSAVRLEEIISRKTSRASSSLPHTPTLSSGRGSPTGGRLSPVASVKASPQSPKLLPSSTYVHGSSTKTESSLKATPAQSIQVESSPMQLFSPGFDAFDPERVFDDDCPIVLIEIGESEARMGLWNVKKRSFELTYITLTLLLIVLFLIDSLVLRSLPYLLGEPENLLILSRERISAPTLCTKHLEKLGYLSGRMHGTAVLIIRTLGCEASLSSKTCWETGEFATRTAWLCLFISA